MTRTTTIDGHTTTVTVVNTMVGGTSSDQGRRGTNSNGNGEGTAVGQGQDIV
jgi:hypothetical protein